jgi:2-polyprenyl-3-methyl-5-hydroxy-6-metoxy-1,4-benzoquinol methylase
MNELNRKKHWEQIYRTKELKDVSWYQPTPTVSLSFLAQFQIPLEAKIIDIGGGDSLLVDHLLQLGYRNITVLDISEKALEKAKERLGEGAKKVNWIIADAAVFEPTEKYDFWHDRATFHFLTQENEITHYLDTIKKNLNFNGVLVIGTFSEQGPEKCSGLRVKQYSENSMTKLLTIFFEKIKCISEEHITPFKTLQQFIFCSFRNKAF